MWVWHMSPCRSEFPKVGNYVPIYLGTITSMAGGPHRLKNFGTVLAIRACFDVIFVENQRSTACLKKKEVCV